MGVLSFKKGMISMLLRSLSFRKELTGDMLDVLFKDVKNYSGEFDYSIELIDAALDGRINMEKEFNLFGYCKTIREGNFQTSLKYLKKHQYLIEEDDEDSTGVKTSSLVDIHNDYEVFEDNEELSYTINKIRTLNNQFIADAGIDLIFCIRQAVKGVPQAVDELVTICRDYSWVGEYIQIILSSGVSFESLFPEDVLVLPNQHSTKVVERVS